MNKHFQHLLSASLLLLATACWHRAEACTGLSLTAKDGSHVVARTCEWGGSDLMSRYVIVPRGQLIRSQMEGREGMDFTTRYGYAGISVMADEFVTEGMNEKGLSVGHFFFPGYGQYEKYDASRAASTLADVQLASYVLANFATIDEAMEGIRKVHVTDLDPRSATSHWRIAEPGGRQIVVEIVGGEVKFYENKVGVLTNSPGFEWHLTNLNNYVNMVAGNAPDQALNPDVTLRSMGTGTGFLGMPGDVTPPSRFVRIAFYRATAPQYATGEETVMQTFHLLNNFDIPIGIEHARDQIPAGLPSATQWTTSVDQKAMRFYYRSAWNSSIRCIDLKAIDFGRVKYTSEPIDASRTEPVQMIACPAEG